jgi:hypothetical protein
VNKFVALIFGIIIFSSCSRPPIELQIVITDGKKDSEKILSYSGRSLQPRVSARGSDSNGFLVIGKGAIDNYFYKNVVGSRTMFFLMEGEYRADLKLLVDGKVCAKGIFKSDGPPKQVRLECRI